MYIETLSAAAVRIGLRVYFLLFFFIIQFVTTSLFSTLAKISVICQNYIRLPRAFSSITGLNLIFTALKLRSLPAGAFGFATLLFIFALNQASDLLTAYLVVSHSVTSRCDFGQGLVFNDSRPNMYSQWNGRPVSVLQNAQLIAVNNSCPYGIYKKVNLASNFCPDDSDILGTWSCTYLQPNLFYPNGTNAEAIMNDLVDHNPQYQYCYNERSSKNGQFDHLVVWCSTASQDPAGSPWSVFAAVQTNPDLNVDAEVQMVSLNCLMRADGASNTLQSMASLYDLNGWIPTMQGLMYFGTGTPAVGNVADTLAMLLNTMVMISGGNNYLLAVPAADADQTQGCLKTVAYVPPVMVAIFFLVCVLLLVVLVGWLWALVRLRSLKIGLLPEEAGEVEMVPQALEEWALMATRKSRNGAIPIKAEELKFFNLGFPDEDKSRVRVFRSGESYQLVEG